jgi:hypothetical protein
LYNKLTLNKDGKVLVMYINVTWDDPDQTILIYRFADSWSAEDYTAAATTEWQLMDSVGHRVDTIIDLQKLYTLPDDLVALVWNSTAHSHLHRGLLILLGKRSITEPFAEALTSLYPETVTDIMQVPTLNAARLAIATQYGIPSSRPEYTVAALSHFA